MNKQIEVKEKDYQNSQEEIKKFDVQQKKMTVDLRAVHILIQTLQKESLAQNQNREAMGNAADREGGSSVLARQQKKVKMLKERVAALEEENKDLKSSHKDDKVVKPKK